MITLSKKTLTMIAAAIFKNIQHAEEELAKSIVVKSLLGMDRLVDMMAPEFSLEDVEEHIGKCNLLIESKKAMLSELREMVQDFSVMYDIITTFYRLEQKFKKAKPWTAEEKTAMETLHDFYEKYEDWILPSADSDIVVRYDEYMKLWDKKNAGKNS